MKQRLFNLFLWLLLPFITLCVSPVSGAKITDVSQIVSGKTYYIGATTSNTDYYLSVSGSTASTNSVAGTAITDKAKAATFIFTKSGDNWTIKFSDSDNYLSLKSSKDNGKVIVNTTANWTITNNTSKSLLTIAMGDYAVQKNNSGTQFGSYGKTQTDVWLEDVSNDDSGDDENEQGENKTAGEDITTIEKIVDGNSYYIKGQKTDGTIQYLSFEDAVKNSVKGTGKADKKDAIVVKFVKVTDSSFQLITPNGYYIQPNSSNGTLAISSTATSCTLSNTSNANNTKGASIAIKVSISNTDWYIQKNKSADNFGGYKNSGYDVILESTTSGSGEGVK